MVKKTLAKAGDLRGLQGQEDTLAAHSSILAWRIPWTEEPRRLQSIGSQRAGHNLALNAQAIVKNGVPGAVHGVTKVTKVTNSQT